MHAVFPLFHNAQMSTNYPYLKINRFSFFISPREKRTPRNSKNPSKLCLTSLNNSLKLIKSITNIPCLERYRYKIEKCLKTWQWNRKWLNNFLQIKIFVDAKQRRPNQIHPKSNQNNCKDECVKQIANEMAGFGWTQFDRMINHQHT